MAPDTLFQVCNTLALAGWICLVLSPLWPRFADAIAAWLIPLLLAVAYVGLVLAFWTRAQGGFGTLPDVMRLFTNPEIALAGWIHYLAFDLFIGAWQIRTARANAIPYIVVLPCLALTFLFGPAGLLLFAAIYAGKSLTQSSSGDPTTRRSPT